MRHLVALAAVYYMLSGNGGVVSNLSHVAGSLSQGNSVASIMNFNGGYAGSRDYAFVPYDAVTTGPYSGHFGR